MRQHLRRPHHPYLALLLAAWAYLGSPGDARFSVALSLWVVVLLLTIWAREDAEATPAGP